jgi:hypothetical protein
MQITMRSGGNSGTTKTEDKMKMSSTYESAANKDGFGWKFGSGNENP